MTVQAKICLKCEYTARRDKLMLGDYVQRPPFSSHHTGWLYGLWFCPMFRPFFPCSHQATRPHCRGVLFILPLTTSAPELSLLILNKVQLVDREHKYCIWLQIPPCVSYVCPKYYRLVLFNTIFVIFWNCLLRSDSCLNVAWSVGQI